jgi:hypothetical protein
MSRQHLFSVLHEHHRSFEELFPYIQSHYGKHGALRVFLRGETHIIASETGVHQGDPFGSTLFALGFHPLLCETADQHNEVLILAYADNAYVVGPIQAALSAAADLKTRLPSASLTLNDSESGIWCLPHQSQSSRFHTHTRDSQLFIQLGALDIPVVHQGFVALGCPIGNDAFASASAATIVDSIQKELDALALFPHHHHRAKIVTFGTNARFTYHTRCWPVQQLLKTGVEVDSAFDAFLNRELPFLHKPPTLAQAPLHEHAIRQIRLNISYGGWGLRSHLDHLPAAVYSSIGELFIWLGERRTDSNSLAPWLGDSALTLPDPIVGGTPGTLLQDFTWACSVLETAWSFTLTDRPSSCSDLHQTELSSRQASRPPSTTIPSLRAVLAWDSSQPFPRQHNLSHHISAKLLHNLLQCLAPGSRDHHRVKALCRSEVPLHSTSSALAFGPPPPRPRYLSVTPRSYMSLTCVHYLRTEDFLDLEALFLGFPIPSLLQSQRSDSLATHGALGDWHLADARHAGNTRKVSHDHLAVLIADFAKRANFPGVQTKFSLIPPAHAAAGYEGRGDIFFPSGLNPFAPNEPFVLDVRLGHIFSGRGCFKSSLLSTISSEKNRKYKMAYSSRQITFAPLPVTTFLSVGPELCHLLYRLAACSGPSACPSASASPCGSQDDPVVHSVTFSRLLKEFQHGVALATLLRLRGRDGFISASA